MPALLKGKAKSPFYSDTSRPGWAPALGEEIIYRTSSVPDNPSFPVEAALLPVDVRTAVTWPWTALVLVEHI